MLYHRLGIDTKAGSNAAASSPSSVTTNPSNIYTVFFKRGIKNVDDAAEHATKLVLTTVYMFVRDTKDGKMPDALRINSDQSRRKAVVKEMLILIMGCALFGKRDKFRSDHDWEQYNSRLLQGMGLIMSGNREVIALTGNGAADLDADFGLNYGELKEVLALLLNRISEYGKAGRAAPSGEEAVMNVAERATEYMNEIGGANLDKDETAAYLFVLTGKVSTLLDRMVLDVY